MEFIRKEKPEKCVFCDAVAEGEPNRELLVLHLSPLGAVIMNRYPYGHGHLLIMPRRHVAELVALTPEENSDLMALLQTSQRVLDQALRPQGYNVGLNLGRAAGAGIEDHLHWHLIPRWIGDINFMTVVGEVRSIPEHLLETYDHLFPLYEKAGS
jgi:ATP adenylyltransferase